MTTIESPTSPAAAEPLFDCVVISDLHLGSKVCQARLLEEFLTWVVEHTRELVINGDIFDDLNFKRLTKHHFAVLKVIRRNTDRDGLRLIWIRGNHDGSADIISHIVGVEIHDEYIFDNGLIRLLIFHGDQFDHFITRYKWVTSAACKLFYLIQKWFPHRASRWIRRATKRFQRNSQVVEHAAVEYAQLQGCGHVTCGHTHLPLTAVESGVHYYNTGTWTDHPPCPFLVVQGGQVELQWWPPADRAADAPAGAVAEPVVQNLR